MRSPQYPGEAEGVLAEYTAKRVRPAMVACKHRGRRFPLLPRKTAVASMLPDI
jgi:hypothetical protein